ncbi:uncharacterized protein LOC106719970 [Papilio machaon]|uniref:uncharacterized protein LOC106719970 n=1 Tax=Papilio machaon TaxID=76193 RepID=UPI001E6656CD|nr:uncharacterized protein LOC106719970 [Papilio machaon]
MRCTRRFSPGTCAEAVVPVWTFDFFALNCTERLGCYLSTRSNRFNTYMFCLHSCRAFIDLYTQTLSEDDEQLKRLRSESRESIRRADGFHQLFYQTEDVYEDDQSEVWEGPASEGAERDDVIEVSDMLVPDIDYTGAQVNNENCDLVHHIQTSKYN